MLESSYYGSFFVLPAAHSKCNHRRHDLCRRRKRPAGKMDRYRHSSFRYGFSPERNSLCITFCQSIWKCSHEWKFTVKSYGFTRQQCPGISVKRESIMASGMETIHTNPASKKKVIRGQFESQQYPCRGNRFSGCDGSGCMV